MKHRVFKGRFLAVILFAAVLRLTWLSALPSGGDGAFWLRLPVAFSGIATVALFMYCVQKFFHNEKLAFVAGLVMTLFPWHIEQSRVFSGGSMFGLTVILAAIAATFHSPQKHIRVILLFLPPILFYLVYPEFWVFQGKFPRLSLPIFGANIFKLTSIEFLFYQNDSYWLGGLRDRGVLLVSCIPLFGLGIYQVAKYIRWVHLRFVLPFFAVLGIAAANPTFPEQMEYFLIIPYFALIISFGVLYLIEYIKFSKIYIKAILIIYIIFLLYDHLLFYHYYTVHYAERIQNEVPRTKITF